MGGCAGEPWTQIQSLGQEDPPEKGMATHSSILAWRIQWTEEPAGYRPWGCKEWSTTEHTHARTQRLVWAAKQPLGNAALGALFA